MYTLYWHPTSSSYAPMAVLEELGVPFDLREVDYARGDNRSPDYLRLQPLGLGQQQVGPLVGGEAAGEADREDAGVERLGHPRHARRRRATGERRLAQAPADEADQALAALLAGPPQLVVGGFGHPRPGVGVGLVPLGPDVAGEQVADLG